MSPPANRRNLTKVTPVTCTPDNTICYHVYPKDGGWTVSFDGQSQLAIHLEHNEAIVVARDAAEARWLITGRPSCVKLGAPDGDAVLDCSYG